MPQGRFYSEIFKESALECYKEHGLKAACLEFDVSKTLILAWRRRKGVENYCIDAETKKKSRLKYHERKQYSPEFKIHVLQDAKLLGPEKAATKHNINSNLIYFWKSRQSVLNGKLETANNICDKNENIEMKEKSSVKYTQEFKISVLSDFNSLGATRTAKKYKINSCLIYKWKAREADWQKNSSLVPGESLKRIKICKKFMSDHQKEVLDYYLEHGIKPTMEMFAIKQKKLHNWRKRFNDQYNGKLFKIRQDEDKDPAEKLEVVEYANTHGLREATLKYGVSIPTIWDWKSKMKMKRETLKKKKVPQRRNIEEEGKDEIVQNYLKEGGFSCEKKYNIPRQTIRYWALQRGVVDINRKQNLVKDALNSAQKEGVQETVAKFSISRASLYNWAKKFGMNMSENISKDSLTLKVTDGKKERNIVFYKKKEKPVKIKFLMKSKKPEKKKKQEEPDLQVLPDWVVEFIKKKVPKVDETGIVLRSNETVFEQDSFKISIADLCEPPEIESPIIAGTSASDPVLESADVSSDPEYECDYVELDLFTSLPFFTPSNDLSHQHS